MTERQALTVTALFENSEKAERALSRLFHAGTPRDLIDIVVSRKAAERFYRGRAFVAERLFAMPAWGLVGVMVGSAISLFMVALPGTYEPGVMAVVQLLGPNFATISGAVLGALIGLFVRRRAERRFARAAEAEDAIVVAVTARSEEEAERLSGILVASGGREPRIER